MAHVTFIHGIGNKPAPEVLLDIWRRSLAHDDGLDLGSEGVTSSMVYWADVLYEKPDEDEAAFENVEGSLEKQDEDIDMSWQKKLTADEARRMTALARKLNFEAPGDEDFAPSESQIDPEFERIPLPGWLKQRLMKTLLRDVHHYLFNEQSSPRPGVSYRVQDEYGNG